MKKIIKKYSFVIITSLVLTTLLLITFNSFEIRQAYIYLIALSYGLILRSIDDLVDYEEDKKNNKAISKIFSRSIILISSMILIFCFIFLHQLIKGIFLTLIYLLIVISSFIESKGFFKYLKLLILPVMLLILILFEHFFFGLPINLYVKGYIVLVVIVGLVYSLIKGKKYE